jgi:hypothetical protein
MARQHYVFDRILGQQVRPITYSNKEHGVQVMTRLLYAEPDGRVEFEARPPKPGEIAKLDKQRKALKAEGKYLPGWTTFQ